MDAVADRAPRRRRTRRGTRGARPRRSARFMLLRRASRRGEYGADRDCARTRGGALAARRSYRKHSTRRRFILKTLGSPKARRARCWSATPRVGAGARQAVGSPARLASTLPSLFCARPTITRRRPTRSGKVLPSPARSATATGSGRSSARCIRFSRSAHGTTCSRCETSCRARTGRRPGSH